AMLFGLCPKFGALVAAPPEGVLGGITVVLYGMIGLLGAKIWVETRVDFGNPVVLVPLAAGLIAGIGGVRLQFTEAFALEGIALGTFITLAGYHLLYRLAPESMRPRPVGPAAEPAEGAGTVLGTGSDAVRAEDAPEQGAPGHPGPEPGGGAEL